MAFFYLSPVKGEITSNLLETISTKRLEHLKSILMKEPATYNEYVLENSVYDNVGHFMLCIVTVLSGNRDAQSFLLKAETDLFKQRLAILTAIDMQSFAKHLLRSIKRYGNIIPSVSEPLQLLCQHLVLKNLAQHICSPIHEFNCSRHSIRVNFKYCLQLIAKREVELENGIAIIPCCKWKKYLVYIFSTNLQNRLTKIDLTDLQREDRIADLVRDITRQMMPLVTNNFHPNSLMSNQVDNASSHFPPCMLNLHEKLRMKHRLSHLQRFYYSLFLKDIGMPVEQAIEFWRLEYQQSPNGNHSCSHNWQRDEKKYVYSIRHMYGLEGGRKNYTSVKCQTIQNSDRSCTEGGCPFKSFDNNNMLLVLNKNHKCTDQTMSQIYELKNKQQYDSACMKYLEDAFHVETNSINIRYNFTPVKYYSIATKNSKTA